MRITRRPTYNSIVLDTLPQSLRPLRNHVLTPRLVQEALQLPTTVPRPLIGGELEQWYSYSMSSLRPSNDLY